MSRVLMALVLVGVAGVSQAATFALIPQVGLAGYGATVQWGFTPYLAASAGYTGLNYAINDLKTSNATYNGDLRLKNPQLFLNWAPFGGSFRVSAGVINPQSAFDLTATDFKDPTAPVSAVRVQADYKKALAPALSIGFESPLQATGLGYHLSLGAMVAGTPDVNVTATCRGAPLNQSACDAYTADERQKIKDDLRKYQVLPILQAGLIFRM